MVLFSASCVYYWISAVTIEESSQRTVFLVMRYESYNFDQKYLLRRYYSSFVKKYQKSRSCGFFFSLHVKLIRSVGSIYFLKRDGAK